MRIELGLAHHQHIFHAVHGVATSNQNWSIICEYSFGVSICCCPAVVEPIIEEMQVRSDVPALAMEEVAPQVFKPCLPW